MFLCLQNYTCFIILSYLHNIYKGETIHFSFGFVQFYETLHIITDYGNNRPLKNVWFTRFLPILHQKQARYVKILSVKR